MSEVILKAGTGRPMTEWHVKRNDQPAGKMPEAELLQAVRAGQVGAYDGVWNTSMAGWQRVIDVPILAEALPPAGPGGLINYRLPQGRPLLFTETALKSLQGTRPWVRFIAVMCFITATLTVLSLLAVSQKPMRSGREVVLLFVAGVFYVTMIGGYFALGIYLKRYADHIAALLRFRTEDHLEHAMEAQRRVWWLTGWLVIAMIVLFIVSIGLVARLMAVP
jgi:hypothetical protein